MERGKTTRVRIILSFENMNNKLSRLQIIAVLGVLIFTGCGGNKNQSSAPDEEDGNVRVWLSEDSTLYGLCGDGSAMNTLQLITDTGDTLNLSVTDAMEKNRVLPLILSSSVKTRCIRKST